VVGRNPTRSGAIDALHLPWPRAAVARTYWCHWMCRL